MGKSRIIATIVVLHNEFGGNERFSIVFPNKLLRSVEEDKYRTLKTLLAAEIDLIVSDDSTALAGKVHTESFVLIDEADQVLLDQKLNSSKQSSDRPVRDNMHQREDLGGGGLDKAKV